MDNDGDRQRNGLEDAREVQEGVPRSVSGNEEGSNPEGLGEAAGGVAGQSVEENEQSKAKRWLVILLILAGVIVIGVVSAVLVMKPWEGKGGEKEDAPVAEVEKDEDGSETGGDADKKSEIEELDINSELVQKLYGQVSGKMRYTSHGSYPYLWMKLLRNGISDEYVKYVALNNADIAQCKITGRNEKEESGNEHCMSGAVVREKAREIFGCEVVFVQNEEVGFEGWPVQMYYDAANDEFWRGIGGGGGVAQVIDNVLYRAEKENDRIYIYELMAQRCSVYLAQEGSIIDGRPAMPGEELLYCIDEVPGMVGGDDAAVELRWYKIDESKYDGDYDIEAWKGENIPEMTTTEYNKLSQYFGNTVDNETTITGLKMFEEQNKQNMLEHADLVSQFRWVFVKNAEGNYVFEKLERVE